MALGEHLQRKLGKRYEPSSTISMKYKRYDLTFKTDAEGNPVVLFIGIADASGNIKGERYTRILKADTNGVIIKDHWDLKGKI
jgi:hypothetical protein